MKKIIISLFSFFVIFGFSSHVFASSGYFSIDSIGIPATDYTITTNGSVLLGRFANDTGNYTGFIYAPSGRTFSSLSMSLNTTFKYIIFSDVGDSSCYQLNYSTCIANDSANILEKGTFNNASINILGNSNPPQTSPSTAGIFFPINTQTGQTSASDLTASVGTATTTTTDSLAPVMAVVMGIILAFMALKWVLSLVYDTGYKQSKKADK
jgi:hypothetical protein